MYLEKLFGENLTPVVKEMSPELEEKNREFLDWLIGWHGDELESYYLSGFCDGIRLFRWIMKL